MEILKRKQSSAQPELSETACQTLLISDLPALLFPPKTEAPVKCSVITLEEVPDGASIAVADDASNLSINLEDLQSIGWLKLKEIPEDSLYTTFDIIENPKNLQLVEMDMFSRFSAMDGDVDLAMSFFSNQSQAKYNFNLLKLFEENVSYPIIAVVREEDKETQWVDDFMDALASETQLERIAEQNKPSLAWKVLFEVAE